MPIIFPLNSSNAVVVGPVVVFLFELALFLRTISFHSNRILKTLSTQKINIGNVKHFECFLFEHTASISTEWSVLRPYTRTSKIRITQANAVIHCKLSPSLNICFPKILILIENDLSVPDKVKFPKQESWVQDTHGKCAMSLGIRVQNSLWRRFYYGVVVVGERKNLLCVRAFWGWTRCLIVARVGDSKKKSLFFEVTQDSYYSVVCLTGNLWIYLKKKKKKNYFRMQSYMYIAVVNVNSRIVCCFSDSLANECSLNMFFCSLSLWFFFVDLVGGHTKRH